MERKIFVQAERLMLGDKVMHGYIEKIRDLVRKGSRHILVRKSQNHIA